MAISKRLRYEVLRRDNHACRYCGATAPDAKLVIDHVIPEALGGSSIDPANLVTACEPCNNGKTSSNPDAPVVAQVADDALRWGRAMELATERLMSERDAREAELDAFLEGWKKCARPFAELPDDWDETVLRFRTAGLPMSLIIDAARRANANRSVAQRASFRYMCGILWNTLRELHDSASAILRGEEPAVDAAGRQTLDQWVIGLHRSVFGENETNAFVREAEESLQGPAEDREIPYEESPTVLAAAGIVGALVSDLGLFQVLVTRVMRQLRAEVAAEIEERVNQRWSEAKLFGVERSRYLLAYIIELAESRGAFD